MHRHLHRQKTGAFRVSKMVPEEEVGEVAFISSGREVKLMVGSSSVILKT